MLKSYYTEFFTATIIELARIIAEDYKWSSALFYEKNIIGQYTWLTHYKG